VRALSGVAAAVVLLVAPSICMAQEPLPVGQSHGVRVVRGQHGIVVVFTKRAAARYRRIAGRLVEVDCTDQQPDQGGPPRAHAFLVPHHPGELTTESSGGITMRAPKHGRRLVTGDGTPGLDYCRVWRAGRTVRRHGARQHIPRRLIVSVPLTQTGAVFLDEESKARRLVLLLAIAGFVADDLKLTGFPSYEQLADRVNVPGRRQLADLAGPEDTPPPRRIGYYSDRGDHIALVVLSRAGRRLLLEADGDVLTTNLTGYIFGDR
jgi:hypothetical protein